MAGASSKNSSCKEFVGRTTKQSGTFHHSGVASKGMQESQLVRRMRRATRAMERPLRRELARGCRPELCECWP